MSTTAPVARRIGASVLLALAPLLVLVCWLVAHDDLPARVATHFGLDGRPDGFSSPGPFTLVIGIVILILSGLGINGVALGRRLATVRIAVALAGWTSWMLTAVVLSVIWPARNVAPADIRQHWLSTFVVLLVASVVGVLIYRILPPGEGSQVVAAGPAPSYTLRPGERATWVGRARSRKLLVTGVALVLVGALTLLLWGRPFSGFVIFLGLVFGWSSELLVRVDGRGITAHFGPIGWPAFRTPLDRIKAVGAQEIEPTQWGGWGYRIGRRGTALVVRRGPGLVISRTGAADLAITVDDADQAAELLNALLARDSAWRDLR